jgi:hypothetical protein
MVEGVEVKVKVEEVIRKEVKEAKVVEVPADLYRAIRSFVESSPKPKYPWNTGINYTNTIKFVKPDKWELEIELKSEIREDLYGCPIRLKSLNPPGDCHHICFKIEKDPIYNRPVINMYVLPELVKFENVDDIELHKYVVYSKDVPFARPITLHEIVKRINHYVDIEKYRTELEKALEQQATQVATT